MFLLPVCICKHIYYYYYYYYYLLQLGCYLVAVVFRKMVLLPGVKGIVCLYLCLKYCFCN